MPRTDTSPASIDRPVIAVVGAGAAGLACAIALAQAGWPVTVVSPAEGPRRDGRTVALMQGSLAVLQGIGAWQALESEAAPLATLMIIDDTGSLLRTPPVSFKARELDLDAFGMNIEAATLVARLEAMAAQTPGLTRRAASLDGMTESTAGWTLALSDGGSLEAALVVGADGRRSLVRETAGITARAWSYDQAAVTAILAHDRDHKDQSTEFHTRTGPFTLVPLPGRRSSLVWLTRPEIAQRLIEASPEDFARSVERQARSMLGAMRLDGPRGVVPMGGLSVRDVAGRRVALVGEAAHVFPPIGAQGLNLGLRDGADLVAALAGRSDPGDPALLADYGRRRRADIAMRTAAVDALNRSLLADLLPVDLARGLGLMLIDRIAPLRRLVMRQGLGGVSA